jgi:hypothetical protein
MEVDQQPAKKLRSTETFSKSFSLHPWLT